MAYQTKTGRTIQGTHPLGTNPRVGPDGLTVKQRQVLRVIASRIEAGLPPPHYREILKEIGGRNVRVIARMIYALERKGFLTRERERENTTIPIVVPNADDRGTARIVIDGTDYKGELTHNGEFWTLDPNR